MKFTAVLSLGLLLGVASPALAAATPEEAQRLTTLFQSYLGQTQGVASVTPAGDSYAAKLDLSPLFAKVKDATILLSLSPLEWTLTDQGGGKWKVEQNQPLSFDFGVKDQSETKGTIGTVSSSSIFDEALGGFATSAAELKSITAEQTVTDKGQTTHIAYALDSVSMKTTMQGSPDGADANSSYSFTNLKETVGLPAASDGSSPAMDIAITAPSGTQDGTAKGVKLKAITDLVAWFVAHQDKQAIVADQSALKDRLRAALPLFASLSGTTTLDDVTAATAFGQFGAKQLGFGAEMSGIVADGRVRETFSFAGLQIPAALLPPWAAGLVPDKVSLDAAVSDFDLAAPAAMMIDKFDMSKPQPLPKDLDTALMQALMPKGTVTVTLGPSEILAKLYDLIAQGSMTAGPNAMPAGEAMVKLKGLEDTMAALQSGPADIQQAGPMLLLLKGLAKQEADGWLSWDIQSPGTGTVTVNGADVTKLLGGGQQ